MGLKITFTKKENKKKKLTLRQRVSELEKIISKMQEEETLKDYNKNVKEKYSEVIDEWLNGAKK